jgi:membrane protease YdiL (CAAX protease family)
MRVHRVIHWQAMGIGYAILLTLVGGYLNYVVPYDGAPTVIPSYQALMLWAMLYVPVLVLVIFARREVKDFGFSVSPTAILAAVFFAALCVPALAARTATWVGAISEAFARTGEELFYRGFLFTLLLRVFAKKRRPSLSAAVFSSLCFAAVHTQTFQAAYFASETGPRAFLIVQRLFNVFLIGFAFALLRRWTGSILPGSIVHSMLQGGPLTLPFVLLLHAAIVVWAVLRKEQVFSRFVGRPIVAR